MKIFMIDAAFPLSKQKSMGMAARCVKWQILKSGLTLSDRVESCDYIFFSSTHPIEASKLKHLKKYQKKIIVGGAGALSPYAYLDYCDCVVLGDGQEVIESIKNKKDIEILDNVLTRSKASVNINFNFPWNCPPIKTEDNSISIFCGRGCKNKCLFCQTGWALKYCENPVSPSSIAKKFHKTHKISYLSNDLSQHTFYRSLPSTGHGSYSIRFLKKNGLPPAHQIRLGIEGVSQKIRSYVNKPISNEDLVNCTSWLNQNKKTVRWFLIAGIPTETDDDWHELKDAILTWKKITPKGVLELSFTAWCPDPATPLCIMPLDDAYFDRFLDFKRWFFDGVGWSNRIKLYAPQKPISRLKKAMASLCIDEKKLYAGGNFGPNDCVNYPYKIASKKLAIKKFDDIPARHPDNDT